jgi:hypothetical protein
MAMDKSSPVSLSHLESSVVHEQERYDLGSFRNSVTDLHRVARAQRGLKRIGGEFPSLPSFLVPS